MLFGRQKNKEAAPSENASAEPAEADSTNERLIAAPKKGHSKQPDVFTALISFFMGLVCLAGGIGAATIIPLIFPVAPSVAGAFSLEKFATFGVTVAVAIVIYIVVVKGTHVFDRLRAVRVRLMDLSLGVFALFSITALYLAIRV